MLPYKGWGARLLASTDGQGAVCRPQGGAWRVTVLACPRLSEARALLEASDLVAHVLHVGANHGGRDALGVVREVRARAATAGAVLGAVHGAPGLGEARVAAEAGVRRALS